MEVVAPGYPHHVTQSDVGSPLYSNDNDRNPDLEDIAPQLERRINSSVARYDQSQAGS
jgi:hypothetical protein